MATQRVTDEGAVLAGRFARVRSLSCDLAAPLSDADATIHPHADASPAKWHLAHTTWFLETFVLRDHVPSYRPHDERWAFLFNSYYEGEGERHARARRGMLSRPSLAELLDYRRAVDEAVADALPGLPPSALELVELGLHHEQQHQELMLMDMLAALAENPLRPAAWERSTESTSSTSPAAPPLRWVERPGGLTEIGHAGAAFAFDAETPRHRVFLRPYALADRPITNGEWIEFMSAGGYADPLLWLADGWAWVRENAVHAPLYWFEQEGHWHRFALDGARPVDPAAPVCHVSFYEADAFARWAGTRLPTEAEWEAAAAMIDPQSGNQLDQAGPVQPQPLGQCEHWDLSHMFGTVWEWTASAFLPYPGFKPAAGTVGEYNGKFMSGQMVLRGGSCATPRGHLRASYRNFFYPHQRWMFSGVRLARDA